ncbi:MAG: M13 family metallopeptidase [Bacteroidia bacterium]|nr:M13 family metallopeptidase [Bacteroidia bacterium]
MKTNFKIMISLALVGFIGFAMKEAILGVGIDPKDINSKYRAQDDFYGYVNSIWIGRNPIPASENSWGNFNELQDKSQKALQAICLDMSAKKGAAKGSNEQLIGDFFASGMDTVNIEKQKFTAVGAELKMIEGFTDKKQISEMLGKLHAMQVNAGFGFFVMSDLKNSNVNAVYAGQSGMGLPEKDYYFNAEMTDIQDAYLKHIVRMLVLSGEPENTALQHARMAYNIEKMLAEGSMTAVEQRDIEKCYNKMQLTQLKEITAAFDWDVYLKTLGISGVNEVIVDNTTFFKQFNSMLSSDEYGVENWRYYFKWRFLNLIAGKMHQEVVDENFYFWGTILNGTKTQQPRWKRVMSVTEGALGDALGQLYVQRHFSEAAKKRVNEMVDNLTAAYEQRIKTRDWMGESTKTQAIAKLHKIMRKLAFPDTWRSYKGLAISRDSYVRNFLNSNKFDVAWILGKFGKPVDKTEWGMTPATINAYYNPTYNEIVFPAAIMQPPFFDEKADDAVNYGAMGAVIGHELTHGFDDQGSLFDGDGNMTNWWTDTDRANFESKTKMLVDQFNAFVAIDSINLHVNGELTLGENIADLGGLTISYYAFQMAQKKNPQPEQIDGFTPNQRFFISWAQAWRNSQRPKSLMNMVKTNPHSPARFRVLGPLSNMKEFYEAFDVKEGDKMWRKPEERVDIW